MKHDIQTHINIKFPHNEIYTGCSILISGSIKGYYTEKYVKKLRKMSKVKFCRLIDQK